MGPVFAILLVTVFVVLLWVATNSAKNRRRRWLREFANSLEGGGLIVDESAWGAEDTHIHGRLAGWCVSLSHSCAATRQRHYVLRYTLDVPIATSDFEFTKAHAFSRLGRWLGMTAHVSSGNPLADTKYNLDGAPQALGKLFQSGEMVRVLDHLFSLRFAKVILRGGRLEVEQVYQHPDQVKPQQLDRVFQALIRVGKICGRRRISVTIRERVTVRFGWTGGTQQILCPYCRDTVDPNSEGLSACDSCQTVHHEACLVEAKRCTIFGCGSLGSRKVSA